MALIIKLRLKTRNRVFLLKTGLMPVEIFTLGHYGRNFSVRTSSPSQTSRQVVARAERKYTHGGVPVQVGLIWNSGTNITTPHIPKRATPRKLTANTCKESIKSFFVQLQLHSLFQEMVITSLRFD